MKREDDFQSRRAHLAELSDAELHQRFWALTAEVVDPLLELGKDNTTPSIERSVLLRMGFSSLEARAIVDGVIDRGLMGRGAGHVVFKLAKSEGLDLRTTGLALAEGQLWDRAACLFEGEAS
ncbi:ornithine aminomutase subunit alpha [uncultured Roseovarius sp.]|uniref:ornithine aminomutase subunit alpha n=1 Tax=uncultured Roseovarius sp. TaxID=293344 RepID=UPI002631649F|nr:ornithine aminomutase subunit alpha [uncultured Roseovarius sp.]